MCLAIPGKILDIQDHDQFMRTGESVSEASSGR